MSRLSDDALLTTIEDHNHSPHAFTTIRIYAHDRASRTTEETADQSSLR
jgi:hypothetical protein